MAQPHIITLSRGGTSLVLDVTPVHTATPIYWGKQLPVASDSTPLAAKFFTPGLAPSATDLPATLNLIPQQSNG